MQEWSGWKLLKEREPYSDGILCLISGRGHATAGFIRNGQPYDYCGNKLFGITHFAELPSPAPYIAETAPDILDPIEALKRIVMAFDPYGTGGDGYNGHREALEVARAIIVKSEGEK